MAGRAHKPPPRPSRPYPTPTPHHAPPHPSPPPPPPSPFSPPAPQPQPAPPPPALAPQTAHRALIQREFVPVFECRSGLVPVGALVLLLVERYLAPCRRLSMTTTWVLPFLC